MLEAFTDRKPVLRKNPKFGGMRTVNASIYRSHSSSASFGEQNRHGLANAQMRRAQEVKLASLLNNLPRHDAAFLKLLACDLNLLYAGSLIVMRTPLAWSLGSTATSISPFSFAPFALIVYSMPSS